MMRWRPIPDHYIDDLHCARSDVMRQRALRVIGVASLVAKRHAEHPDRPLSVRALAELAGCGREMAARVQEETLEFLQKWNATGQEPATTRPRPGQKPATTQPRASQEPTTNRPLPDTENPPPKRQVRTAPTTNRPPSGQEPANNRPPIRHDPANSRPGPECAIRARGETVTGQDRTPQDRTAAAAVAAGWSEGVFWGCWAEAYQTVRGCGPPPSRKDRTEHAPAVLAELLGRREVPTPDQVAAAFVGALELHATGGEDCFPENPQATPYLSHIRHRYARFLPMPALQLVEGGQPPAPDEPEMTAEQLAEVEEWRARIRETEAEEARQRAAWRAEYEAEQARTTG